MKIIYNSRIAVFVNIILFTWCIAGQLIWFNIPHVFGEEKSQDTSQADKKKNTQGLISYYTKDSTIYVTMKVKNCDLRQILQDMADIKKLNLVLDKDVKGEISLSLKDVSWDDALKVIMLNAGLAGEIDDKVVYMSGD